MQSPASPTFLHTMNKHVSALALACLATLGAGALQAQGLRPSSGGGMGLGTGPRLSTLPSLPTGPAPVQQADSIVAVVNSEPITSNELRMRTARTAQQMAQQNTPVPPESVLTQQVLENLITEKALQQQARDTGIKIDDLLVDQAEANVARQNSMDVAQLRRRLARNGVHIRSKRRVIDRMHPRRHARAGLRLHGLLRQLRHQRGVFTLFAHGRAVFAIERDVEHAVTVLGHQLRLQLQAFAHTHFHAAVVVTHGQRLHARLGAKQNFTGMGCVRHRWQKQRPEGGTILWPLPGWQGPQHGS